VLGVEARAARMLGQHATTELHPKSRILLITRFSLPIMASLLGLEKGTAAYGSMRVNYRKGLGMVAQTCNPSIWEAEAGERWV
jgi:hypothetical protein